MRELFNFGIFRAQPFFPKTVMYIRLRLGRIFNMQTNNMVIVFTDNSEVRVNEVVPYFHEDSSKFVVNMLEVSHLSPRSDSRRHHRSGKKVIDTYFDTDYTEKYDAEIETIVYPGTDVCNITFTVHHKLKDFQKYIKNALPLFYNFVLANFRSDSREDLLNSILYFDINTGTIRMKLTRKNNKIVEGDEPVSQFPNLV